MFLQGRYQTRLAGAGSLPGSPGVDLLCAQSRKQRSHTQAGAEGVQRPLSCLHGLCFGVLPPRSKADPAQLVHTDVVPPTRISSVHTTHSKVWVTFCCGVTYRDPRLMPLRSSVITCDRSLDLCFVAACELREGMEEGEVP